MKNQFDNKVVLVIGSSGSWGNELIKQLLETNVKEIRGMARGEFAQVSLQRKFNDPRLKIIIGDVRDYNKLDSSCRGVDIVFLLSALKHVPICEDFPYEAIKTNINGTRNVVRACIANNVKKCVDVSSDKACLPINTYGMTKAVGEKLILNGARLGSKTQFMVVRGGNVLGSAGSVIPFWIDQIKRFKKVSITDKTMTRYFLTLPEAIKLLFTAVESNINGGLFVMKMPSASMLDMAKVVIDHYAKGEMIIIEEIGIRPGEKIDEVLVSKHEALNAYEYNIYYYLITEDPNWKWRNDKAKFEEYNSATKLMNKDEIKDLLQRGGFLK